MMDHLNQMDTQESTVKVDLLHLDPTDPDGGCCCGKHSGSQSSALQIHSPRRTLLRTAPSRTGEPA